MSSTTAVTTLPLPFDLVSMYEELSVVPYVDIVRNVTEAFVTQQHDEIAPAVPDSGQSSTVRIDTLLKCLIARMDMVDSQRWSPEQLRSQRDEMLAGDIARALGGQLYSALGLDPEAHPPHPGLFSQLTWCALLFELEPPEQRRPSHLAGLDLCSPDMMGKKLRHELVQYLQWKTRTINGYRSSDIARLAISLLEPLYSELARDDLPATLRCGSLAWSTFSHGVALAEALQSGSAAKTGFPELENQLLTLSQSTNEEELRIIAAACVRPALHWATVQGKVAHREDGAYTEEDMIDAQKALDERRSKAIQSIEMLFSNIPDRFEMARKKLREVHAGTAFGLSNWAEYPIHPVGFATQWEYIPHEYVDYKSNDSSRFTMLDLFAAGRTLNGSDEFRPYRLKDSKTGIALIAPDLDRLRGINMPALFDEAFNRYWKNAEAGYEFLIETLLEQLPAADRKALSQGSVSIYALREQKAFPASKETPRERLLLRGRMGFLIQCAYGDQFFSYEVFPLQAHLVRRTDLGGMRNVWIAQQLKTDVRLAIAIDWQAYRDGRIPLPRQTARLVPALLGAVGPAGETPRNLQWVSRLIVEKHMFFDREQLYAQQRGKAFVENVEDTFPVLLAIASVFIPGLGCYNALKTNQHLAVKIATCTIDIASILLLPAVRLGAGVAGLARQGGQITVAARLTALAGMTRKFVKVSAISYAAALNPIQMLKPFYWGARLAYRGGSRGVLALSRLRTRVASAPGFRHTFRMPPAGLPNRNRINNATDLDDFLRQNDIFGSTESLRRQRRQGALDLLEEGAEVRVHTRPDGTKTLITPDEITARQVTYIDLANDTTVTMGGVYNYRQLRTWTTVAGGSEAGVINVPIANVTATRSALEADRVTSVKTAMEQGIPLPALDVTGASGSYTIVNGNHRLQAAQQLGLETVPIKVATATTVAVPSSQIGYTANYGLHVRGILVVPAVLSQTSEKQQARP